MSWRGWDLRAAELAGGCHGHRVEDRSWLRTRGRNGRSGDSRQGTPVRGRRGSGSRFADRES
eukprot:7603365-Ditylum_brightwellii.AAC.1